MLVHFLPRRNSRDTAILEPVVSLLVSSMLLTSFAVEAVPRPPKRVAVAKEVTEQVSIDNLLIKWVTLRDVMHFIHRCVLL